VRLDWVKHTDVVFNVPLEDSINVGPRFGLNYAVTSDHKNIIHASMLVHVCDVFDALRTHRPYRVAWEANAVVDYITQRTNTEFHPDVARAFVSMLREREVREARADAIDGLALAHSVA
jgi:hypothetical protein